MLQSSVVLHQAGTGRRGGDGDVVGISWKAPTKSHPSPALMVTWAHQVVVYKPGESRRTHQWSFKPSAATILSHAAVFLPAGSRYVGVQQGSTIVSWRESEQDVKRPLSVQASGAVQAVHACPQLGEYFVAVLASGGVALYHGGLQCVAHCGAPGTGSAPSRARAKTVWSGVRGNQVIVLEKVGMGERITTFVLSAASPSRRGVVAGDVGADGSASVSLVSSHALIKPSSRLTGAAAVARGGGDEGTVLADQEPSACSASFLRGDVRRGGTLIAVAWRTSSGPVWTKIAVGGGGAREEFARPAGAVAGSLIADGDGDRDAPVVALTNGHDTPKSKKSKKSAARGHQLAVSDEAKASAGWSGVPAVAAADGGRLLVHSGGANPRLAIWDAAYGVLLEDTGAPEANEGGATPFSREGKAVVMAVSGDGAHLGLAVAGTVIICPLPIKEAGTLASLLRRKRPSPSIVACVAGSGCGVGGAAYPSVDLARSARASNLLSHTGTLEKGQWEAAVVMPFREEETKVVRSLQDAARRKDCDAFERALGEHLQQRAAAVAAGAGTAGGEVFSDDISGEVSGGRGSEARKRRRRKASDGVGYSAAVVSAAVELCLANPDAELWGALAVLVRSGGVSARHHRGLVAAIVQHASPELLEEVMLNVPDLPEADAVRILRYFLSRAAADVTTTAAGAGSPDLLTFSGVVPKGGANGVGLPPVKRARGGGGVAVVKLAPGKEDTPEAIVATGGVGDVVGVSSSRKPKRSGDGETGTGNEKKKKKIATTTTTTTTMKKTAATQNGPEEDEAGGDGATISMEVVSEDADRHKDTNGTKAGLSNGRELGAVVQHDDGGTSGDSSGFSEGGTPQAFIASGGGDAEEVSKKRRKTRSRAGGAQLVETPAARAERGVRVALTLPHNEAFLRSALAGMSHGEVVVVLKVLTGLLSEGRTREGIARGGKLRGRGAAAAKGLPSVRTDSVLGWASAVLDSHFARLAMGGAADAGLVSALRALREVARGEAECCELLSQVRSLVDEIGRRHVAAAAEKARRHPKTNLFTLRVLRF